MNAQGGFNFAPVTNGTPGQHHNGDVTPVFQFGASSSAGADAKTDTKSGDQVSDDVEMESWSRTIWRNVKGRHVWIIGDAKNFLARSDENTHLKSMPFQLKDRGTTYRFQIVVNPKGDKYGEYISLQLFCLNPLQFQDKGVEVKFAFALRAKDDKDVLSSSNLFSFKKTDSIVTPWQHFIPNTIENKKNIHSAFSRKDMEKKADMLMDNNELTIVCQVNLILATCEPTKNPDMYAEHKKFAPNNKTLASDIENFYQTNKFHDVVLVCGSQRLPCHKAILAARSDVFHAMFRHEESNQGEVDEVEIKDVSGDIMEMLLEFMYSDKVSNLPEYASDLFVAADKYNLPELRSLCEKVLIDNINVDNVSEILHLTSLHMNTQNLKSRAMDFVTSNLKKVSATEGWKDFVSRNPKVMEEILLREFADQK